MRPSRPAIIMLLLAARAADAEPMTAPPWRVGALGGFTLSALGGHDADVVAEDGTTAAMVLGARVAHVWDEARPLLRVQVEPSFIQRKVGSWIFTHLEAPVVVEVAWPWRSLSPYASGGIATGWVIASTRPSSGGERGDLEAASLHIAALAGAGVRQ